MDERKESQQTQLFREELAMLIPRVMDIPEGCVIAVNRVAFWKNKKLLHILVTIFPEAKEEELLYQLKKKRHEFREELRERFPHRRVPQQLFFEIDEQAKSEHEINTILDSIQTS